MLRLSLSVRWLAVAVWLFSPGLARAQGDTPEAVAPAGQIDVADLWRIARRKPPQPAQDTASPDSRLFIFVAPTIGAKPSTGVTGGVAADVSFFLGDPGSTHISTLTGGLRVSTKNQQLGNIRFAAFSSRDKWLFQGDDRMWWTSQDTYGLGGNTPSAAVENVKYDQMRFFQTAYRNVAPGLFVGAGVNISDTSDVRPAVDASPTWNDSAYVVYSQTHGFALDGQTSSGPSVSLTFDTRDNQINAYRGSLASATYRTFFDGFLGGDSTWHELFVDARTYKGLTRDARHRLAFWFLADLVTTGTAPYFDLPSTGTPERAARGYADGRYRGEHMLYGEMEYRGALMRNGLLGMVAFFNLTTVDNVEAGDKLFQSFAPAGGLGLRVLLNKRSRSTFAIDYAWGKDGSRGFYLYLQEAF